MISGKQLHGLKVKDSKNQDLGIVVDLLAERTSGEIKGFIIDQPGIITRRAFVPYQQVRRCDLSGLYVEDKSSLCNMKKYSKDNLPNDKDAVLRMHEVASARGAVKDVFLEKEKIVAAEVSGGVFMDMREGRQTIPWEEL